MATQTILPFDPYIRANNQGASNGKKRTETFEDDDMPIFHLSLTPPPTPTPTTTSNSNTLTTPTTPPSNTPAMKIDFKNITDWNSLKKSPSSSASTSPVSRSPFPHLPRNTNGKTPHSTSPTKHRTPNSSNTTPSKPKIVMHPSTTTTTSTSTNTTTQNHAPLSQDTAALNLTSPSPFTSPSFTTSTINKKPLLESNGTSHGDAVTKPTLNGLPKGPKPKIVKSKCKDIVILPTSLDKDSVARLKGILKELGGSLVTKYTSEVSHIVSGLTGAHCARRTMKYCMGVVEGKWVVSFDWCVQSETASCWLDEERFEVDGDSVTLGGPRAAREAILSETPPLFTDCHIYLQGDFTTPTKAEVKKLLQLGGAEVLGKPPKGKNRASITEAVVCNATAFSSLSEEEVAKLKDLGRAVVDARWALDCVSYYQILPFSEYELSPSST